MKTIDDYLQSLIDKNKTPSVSYILFDSKKTIHSFAQGYADIIRQRKINSKTTYSGFSVTKTFTALAILQLVEKGEISLEDKVKNHVKNFPYSSEITIRQLLTHSSGVPNPLPLKWVHSPSDQSSFDRDEFFNRIFELNNKVKFSPNEKFSYSNIGYYVLGKIIENKTGARYEEYVRQNILDPIGIKNNELGFDIPDANQHAKGYQKKYTLMNFLLGFLMDKSKYVNQTEGKWISFKDIRINGTAHGGLIGTSDSFKKYIQELLKTNSSLISQDYKQMLFTENYTNSNKPTGMCFSWFKGQLGDYTYYSHAGGGAGYYCEIRIYPEQGLGSVVMFNRTGVKDERILDKLDRHYFDTL